MGVVVVDRDLQVQAWNEAATELWGVRADEVHGAHFLNLDIGLPVGELSRAIRETMKSGEPREVTVDAHDRRGRAIRCRVRTTPLDGSDPGVDGAMLVVDTESATR